MYKPALLAGSLFAGLAVMLGAFAAHGLARLLPPEKIDVFQKGVTYQFYHGFALLLVGIIYWWQPTRSLQLSVVFFSLGIMLFSGTLYLFPLLEVKDIPIPVFARLITPLGGLAFIGGWLLVLTSVLSKN